jgi:hypothetical protein
MFATPQDISLLFTGDTMWFRNDVGYGSVEKRQSSSALPVGIK